MNEAPLEHVPVLPDAVREHLGTLTDGVIVDCTLGLGGHAEMLLRNQPRISLIGIDVDEDNLNQARLRLAPFGNRARAFRANFAELRDALSSAGIAQVQGVLADLGVASTQIDRADRGFSFDHDGPLDMRMDNRQALTAAELVNRMTEKELSDLLYFQAQERHSRRIAKRICQARKQGRITTTGVLARVVASAVGEDPDSHRGRIHPATRTFLALRMAVNREMDSLRTLLDQAPALLAPGGRIVVISFHSTEDRVVKEDFRTRAREGVYRVLTRKPVTADDAERESNPRSRSAKLRAAERVVGA